MTPEPGRNAPCSCGSGRKYKQCCLATAGAMDQARVRVRRAEGRVVDTLLRFALERFGKPFFEHAWLDFWAGEPPEANEFTDIPEFDAMFVPWFVTAFVRDPHGDHVAPDWPDEPLGLYWLRTERPALDAVERAWLEAVCRSPMSIFLVERVDPGRSLDLRDVLTGRDFHVLEQTASRSIHPTDLLFVRVVTTGDVCLMFGMAPYAVPARMHIDILDWRDRVFTRKVLSRHDLMEFDIEIRDFYLDVAERIRNPVMPQLRNTDGDQLEPTTLVYGLSAPVEEVLERLRPLATLGDDEHVSDVEVDEAGVMTSAIVSWVKAGNRKNKSWDNTVLGTLRVTTGQLTADVNSVRRADRLVREIRRLLGGVAVLRERSVDNVERMLKAARTSRTQRAAGTSTPDLNPERPPELDVLEDEMYREHLEAWIDSRIPALGNRTPRQVARSARGRERLHALVNSLEGRRPDARPARREAVAAIRRTLGLDTLVPAKKR